MKSAWILTGDGINCEEESAEACRRAGFTTEIIHLSELVSQPRDLAQCSLLVLPGGFSFGDELGSGRVLALKIRYELGWNLTQFVDGGGLVLGICNGFQTLVALGAFGTGVALASNESGRFLNEWVKLKVDPAMKTSPFLRDIDSIELPIRHGEGRVLYGDGTAPLRAAMTYVTTPNGSHAGTAGLIDKTGRIFGLMPHPEGYLRASQHPGSFRTPGPAHAAGDGLKIFKNAFHSARSL
ncbi:MAG: phosphoribosylformylglycinamidine synthase subunit PurQ [Cryobacterium sp.]|nr:phosphoribosylformylglycinamidine synthase subunit PurQ [Oligoflexia bacterium]